MASLYIDRNAFGGEARRGVTSSSSSGPIRLCVAVLLFVAIVPQFPSLVHAQKDFVIRETEILLGDVPDGAGLTTGQRTSLNQPRAMTYHDDSDTYVIAQRSAITAYRLRDGSVRRITSDVTDAHSVALVGDLLYYTHEGSFSVPGGVRRVNFDGTGGQGVASSFQWVSSTKSFKVPAGITIAPDPTTFADTLYVTDAEEFKVVAVNPTTGAANSYIGQNFDHVYFGGSATATLGAPRGIVWLTTSNVFLVADSAFNVIHEITVAASPSASVRFGQTPVQSSPKAAKPFPANGEALDDAEFGGVANIVLHPTRRDRYFVTCIGLSVIILLDEAQNLVQYVVNENEREGVAIGHINGALRTDNIAGLFYVDARDEMLFSTTTSPGRVYRASNFLDQASDSTLRPQSDVELSYTVGGKLVELIKRDLTWEQASAYCASRTHVDRSRFVRSGRPGRLATLLSQEEHDRAYEILVAKDITDAWIGANALDGGGYRWRFGPLWFSTNPSTNPQDPSTIITSSGSASMCGDPNEDLIVTCKYLRQNAPISTDVFISLERRTSNYVGYTSSQVHEYAFCEYPLTTAEFTGYSFMSGPARLNTFSELEDECVDRLEQVPGQSSSLKWQMPVIPNEDAGLDLVRVSMLHRPARRVGTGWPMVATSMTDEGSEGTFRSQVTGEVVYSSGAGGAGCQRETINCNFANSEPRPRTTAAVPSMLGMREYGRWETTPTDQPAATWACSLLHETATIHETKTLITHPNVTSNVSFADAEDACVALSTTDKPVRIARVNTYTEAITLENFVGMRGLRATWIGGIDVFLHSRGDPGLPTPRDDQAFFTAGGELNLRDRSDPARVVCERHESNHAKLPLSKLIVTEMELRSVADARSHCQTAGGRLPAPHSVLYLETLGVLVRAALPPNATVWLDGSCIGKTCRWNPAPWEASPLNQGTDTICWQAVCAGLYAGVTSPAMQPPDEFAELATSPIGQVVGLTATEVADGALHHVVCEVPHDSTIPTPVLPWATPAPTTTTTAAPTPAPTTTTTTTTTTVAPAPNTTVPPPNTTTTAPTVVTATSTPAPVPNTTSAPTTASTTSVTTAQQPPTSAPVTTTSAPGTTLPAVNDTSTSSAPIATTAVATTTTTAAPITTPPPPTATRERTLSHEATASRARTASKPATVTPSLSTSRTVTVQIIPEKPRPRASVNTEKVLAEVMPTESAQAVTATSQSAVLASSAASPAAATKGANLASIASIVDCAYSEDDLEPSWMEVGIVWSFGSSPHAPMIGSSLSLVFFLWLLHVALAITGAYAPRWRKRVGLLASVFMAYFAPTVAGMATTVALHGSPGEAALGVGIFIANLGTIAAPLAVIARAPAAVLERLTERTTAQSVELMKDGGESVTEGYLMCYVALYEPARSLPAGLIRLVFFEDVIAAIVLGTISGIRPESGGSCTTIGVLMLVIALAHCVYMLAVRPFQRVLDQGFGNLIAIAQLALCVVAVVTLHEPAWAVGLAWLAVGMAVIFLVQTIVIVLDSILNRWMKRRAEQGRPIELPEFMRGWTRAGRRIGKHPRVPARNADGEGLLGSSAALLDSGQAAPAWSLAAAYPRRAPPNPLTNALRADQKSGGPAGESASFDSAVASPLGRGRTTTAAPVKATPAMAGRPVQQTPAMVMARLEAQLLGAPVDPHAPVIAPSSTQLADGATTTAVDSSRVQRQREALQLLAML